MKNELIISDQDLKTLEQAGVIPAGTPAAIVKVFAESCRQYGLSPFRKEIYLVGYNSRTRGPIYSTIVGIEGMRRKAAESGMYAGKDDCKYNVQADGSFQTSAMLAAQKQIPITATVTVYRIVSGIRCPFTKTVVFKEFCPAEPRDKWATMPYNMIEKVAEAHALRMGFSGETSGLYIEEEGAAIQDATIAAKEQNPEETYTLHDDNLAEIEGCATIEELKDLYAKRKADFEEKGSAAKAAFYNAIVNRRNQLEAK